MKLTSSVTKVPCDCLDQLLSFLLEEGGGSSTPETPVSICNSTVLHREDHNLSAFLFSRSQTCYYLAGFFFFSYFLTGENSLSVKVQMPSCTVYFLKVLELKLVILSFAYIIFSMTRFVLTGIFINCLHVIFDSSW